MPTLPASLRPFLPMLGAALLSVLLYGLVYAVLVKKPQSIGIIGQYFERKLEAARAIQGPKLMIMAGSGGRYSHRCQTLEAMLDVPCVNGSINAHVGIDILFAKYRPVLQPGDTVYLPIEYELWEWDKKMVDSRPSSAYLLEYEPGTLLQQGPLRAVKGFFYFDLPYLFSGAAEMVLARAGLKRKAGADRLFSVDTMNRWGDESGHTAAQGQDYAHIVRGQSWEPPAADSFHPETTYSGQVVSGFLDWAREHQVRVVGGLASAIDEKPIPDEVVERLRTLFQSHGAGFVVLDNRSQYPRSCFFDTIHHLNEECQIAHSRQLAVALRPLLTTPRR